MSETWIESSPVDLASIVLGIYPGSMLRPRCHAVQFEFGTSTFTTIVGVADPSVLRGLREQLDAAIEWLESDQDDDGGPG